jgi:hypothetical protein
MIYLIVGLASIFLIISVLSIMTYFYVQKHEDLKGLLNGDIAAWDYREDDNTEADIVLLITEE